MAHADPCLNSTPVQKFGRIQVQLCFSRARPTKTVKMLFKKKWTPKLDVAHYSNPTINIICPSGRFLTAYSYRLTPQNWTPQNWTPQNEDEDEEHVSQCADPNGSIQKIEGKNLNVKNVKNVKMLSKKNPLFQPYHKYNLFGRISSWISSWISSSL